MYEPNSQRNVRDINNRWSQTKTEKSNHTNHNNLIFSKQEFQIVHYWLSSFHKPFCFIKQSLSPCSCNTVILIAWGRKTTSLISVTPLCWFSRVQKGLWQNKTQGVVVVVQQSITLNHHHHHTSYCIYLVKVETQGWLHSTYCPIINHCADFWLVVLT